MLQLPRLLLVLVACWRMAQPFMQTPVASSRRPTFLMSGYGIAGTYKWQEEAFEIELTVKVPKDTKAKDVVFTPSVRSMDLRLRQADGDESILIDGSRTLRGRVNLDGTYWVISDSEDDNDFREVTVTIEKMIQTPKDDFEIVEYDWKGIFVDDEGEVSESKYDEPEVLDVREYSKQLGVDIDNIDMSLVDKSMFSSGMNISQSTMEELDKSGIVQEITRQADGTEYTVDDEGQAQAFSPLGDIASPDEVAQATAKPKIPFIDTDSPWNNVVPISFDEAANQTVVRQTRNLTRAAFAADSAKKEIGDIKSRKRNSSEDPIDNLTVERLKEILKSQGLKTNGNKAELQDRLRQQVNALLQGKQDE